MFLVVFNYFSPLLIPGDFSVGNHIKMIWSVLFQVQRYSLIIFQDDILNNAIFWHLKGNVLVFG